MTLQECYTTLKGNYEEAKGRLMNDKLVSRFILKFPNDPSMGLLREMVAAGNNEDAFRAVHTLKGVAANLAFTDLFESASALTEQMRPLTSPADKELMARVEDSYALVIATLKQYEQEL